jgi:hypothetical protein
MIREWLAQRKAKREHKEYLDRVWLDAVSRGAKVYKK